MRKVYLLFIAMFSVLIIGAVLISSPGAGVPVTRAQVGNMHVSFAHNSPLFKIPPTLINSTPAFTIANVRQALQTHSFRGGPTLSNTQPAIEMLAFMTMKKMAAYLSSQTGHTALPGLYPDRLVCYVQLRGPFLMEAEHLLGGQIPVAARGFEVFDARTGLLFEWGTLA